MTACGRQGENLVSEGKTLGYSSIFMLEECIPVIFGEPERPYLLQYCGIGAQSRILQNLTPSVKRFSQKFFRSRVESPGHRRHARLDH
jgi:hypothetical protein